MGATSREGQKEYALWRVGRGGLFVLSVSVRDVKLVSRYIYIYPAPVQLRIEWQHIPCHQRCFRTVAKKLRHVLLFVKT